MVFAEEMYQKITTPDKYLFVKNTEHYEYASNDSEKFVAEMESIINKGYVDPTFAYSGASYGLISSSTLLTLSSLALWFL